MKKRILMCAESSHLKSGFGNYTRELLTRLHQTGKYEIAELSCYRDNSIPKTEPWKIYPVAVTKNNPLYKEYESSDINKYGQWRFEYALLDFKPHIVFDIRDYWMFTYQEISPLRPFYYWIISPTYDSSPQRLETITTFKNADRVLFHTDWAKKDLITNLNYKHNNVGEVVNDSVDPNIFKPLSKQEKINIREQLGIPKDAFVIGTVMRNQKRKLIPDILQIFKNILSKNKKAFLHLHTSYPDGLAWDLPSLLLEYGIQNNVLITYKCTSCLDYYVSTWKGPKTICRSCSKESTTICGLANPISEVQLNNIYNSFDIYIQYAICEGFGIPPLEAASAGTPVITIDFGAMGDVGRKINAKLVPVIREFREQETNAIRCYPDNLECEKIILDMMSRDLENDQKEARTNAIANYSWDKTAKEYENIFDSVDLSKVLQWNSDKRKTNLAYKIIDNDNNRKFIYDIIDNVICEPWIKHTNFSEEIIKSLNDGYMPSGQSMIPFNKERAVQLLQNYLNNKIGLDILRLTDSIEIPPKLIDFIQYSKL